MQPEEDRGMVGKLSDELENVKWTSQLFLQDVSDSLFRRNCPKDFFRFKNYVEDSIYNFEETEKRSEKGEVFAIHCKDPHLKAQVYKDLSILSLAESESMEINHKKPEAESLLHLSQIYRRRAKESDPQLDFKEVEDIDSFVRSLRQPTKDARNSFRSY